MQHQLYRLAKSVAAALEPTPAQCMCDGSMTLYCEVCAPRRVIECLMCEQDFVIAGESEPHGQDHWRMALRCTNCGWRNNHAVVRHAEVIRFNADRLFAQQLIEDALRLADRMDMLDTLSTLEKAFAADLLTADDFLAR